MFITFEGIEGSGKTTQLKILANFLRNQKINVLTTKEPGGTYLGKYLKKILVKKNDSLIKIYSKSELLLFLADRIQHIEEIILPALAMDIIVLCDRYFDTTIAYQGYGRKLNLYMVNLIKNYYLMPLKPDLTFLFDLPVKQGMKRVFFRSYNKKKNNCKKDRFENESFDFHTRVRKGYLTLAQKDPQRFKIIDATKHVEYISMQLQMIILNKIKKDNIFLINN